MGGLADDWAATVKKWWAKPLNTDGDVLQWFLFLGLVIVIIIAWNTILKFILEE
jgi:hypothetical protein